MPPSVRLYTSRFRRNYHASLAFAALFFVASPGIAARADLIELRARATKGDAEAMNELGNVYAIGQGVERDFAEALRQYGMAADRGIAAAQFNLGMMHELGRGVPVNPTIAFQYYQRAARQGFAPAQFNVANMYANGLGVKADYFEAALWFRQAAERNVAEAQYNLALAYELGRGVMKDEVAAQRWYRAAAGQRFAQAQFNLALMLEEGRGSTPNPAESLEFYRAAASQNFVPAQQNLGIILADGAGGEAALVEAYVWLALAVENGAKPTGRDIVAQKLTPAQRSDADQNLTKKRKQLGMTDGRVVATPIVVEPVAVAAVEAPPPVPTIADRQTEGEEVERLRRENVRLAAIAEAAAQEGKRLEKQIAASELSLSAAVAAATAAHAEAKAASVAKVIENNEREKLAQRLVLTQADLDEARLRAERAAAEISRLQNSTGSEAPQPQKEYPALLTQLETLTREVATLRAEKVDMTRRLGELTSPQSSARSGMIGSESARPVSVDTRFIPLQELAVTDRRIAKLISDNARLQEHVKKSVAELTELSRQLLTPEPRPESGLLRTSTGVPVAR